MSSFKFLLVRQVRLASLVLACVAPFAAVHAQSAPQPAPPPPPPDTLQGQQAAPGRENQKIERIHVEDSGAAVDEVRYGGQTQSITVKPKANVPSYQVLPNEGGYRPGQSGSSDAGPNGNGPRVWNVLKF